MNTLILKGYVKAQCAKMRLLDKLHRDQRGAGVAEYAMIIGIAVIIGVSMLLKFWGEDENSGLRGVFTRLMIELTDATTK